MSKGDELLKEAKEARALAAKARRLAMGTNPTDAARLIAYADELEELARTFERRAGASDL